ncbi:hypothetical protein CCYA_CCYA09G2695 [Cyanidiococcus yangmingshanensis]|nr:hypothetical protein CCYA_CCYA09G2695 [Cyanidiococcus yangmingshanensis]
MSEDISEERSQAQGSVDSWARARVDELRNVVLSGQAAGVFSSPQVVPALEVDRALRELERTHARPLRREQASCAGNAYKESLKLLRAEFVVDETWRSVESLLSKAERLRRCYRFIEQDWKE